MTHDKNNLPIQEEQQFIQQKIKIPSYFVELKTVGKNYICSTQGWPKEPVCERYGFLANGKWVQLDIPQKIIKKLELELGKEITYPIYISQKVLEQKPDEFGVITINNEKDILLQTEEIILIKEKETQVDFTSREITDLKQKLERSEQLSQEVQTLLEKVLKDNEEKGIVIIFFEQQIKDLTNRITELRNNLENEILAKKRTESKNRELERIIKKLKEDEQVLIGLQNKNSDLHKQLGNERLAWEETKQDLQNKIQERDEQLAITQLKNGNEVLECLWQIGLLKKEITQLDNIIKLLKELSEEELKKNQDTINGLSNQVNQLTAQRNNFQTQANDLNQQLTDANNSKRDTERLLREWTDKFINKNANQVYEELKEITRRRDGLQTELNNKKINKERIGEDFRKWYEENFTYFFFTKIEEVNWPSVIRLINNGFDRGDIVFRVASFMLPEYIDPSHIDKSYLVNPIATNRRYEEAKKELEINFHYLWSRFLIEAFLKKR